MIKVLAAFCCMVQLNTWMSSVQGIITHRVIYLLSCIVMSRKLLPSKCLNVPFHSIGCLVWDGSGLPRPGCSLRLIWRWTLSLQTDPSDARSRITEEPISGASWNGNQFVLIISKENQSTIQFFHYRLSLFPVQLHTVSQVNVVAKSNTFPFLTILAWDRKRVNVAR